MYHYTFTTAYETQQQSNLKPSSYGTVIYLPQDARVDFGQSTYPSRYDKKTVCPRVLLVSTWTDGKYGLVGGGVKAGETPVAALNREFLEEIGTEVLFDENDFCFSHSTDKRIAHVFCRITHDVNLFENLLKSFFSLDRKAYVDEILSVVGYPLWIEGPDRVEDVSWNNNVWGLPRHLTFQGGMITPTLGGTNFPRESLILILMMKSVISPELMRRVFELASYFDKTSCPLDSFDEFVTRTGLRGTNIVK